MDVSVGDAVATGGGRTEGDGSCNLVGDREPVSGQGVVDPGDEIQESMSEHDCCRGIPREDCPVCGGRYQVSSVGLRAVLLPLVAYGHLCESIRVAVDEACVRYESEKGVNLVVTAVQWCDSQEGESLWSIYVTMSANCVQTRLESALRREIRSLQSKAVAEAVVDTGGYGPPGQEMIAGVHESWSRSWWQAMQTERVRDSVEVRRWGDVKRHAENVSFLGSE